MELEISHTTKYVFSQPVFLEPHVLRFQPRADGAQTPLEFTLDVDPPPAGMAACLDAAGNTATHAWFDGLHQGLHITAFCVVRMVRDNPFDYLLDPARMRLPLGYGADADILCPYLLPSISAANEEQQLAALAARLREASRGELPSMLMRLNDAIYSKVSVIRRDEGQPWPAERTWREKRGACRDLAVLFIEVCRRLGVASRFVSGYEEAGVENEPCDLHAWAEVYIPGGGWRGYDPSRGLAVTQHHVAVAAAADPAGAAPVSGTLRGVDAATQMESEIRIERRARAMTGLS